MTARSSSPEHAVWTRLHTQVFTATLGGLALVPWTVTHWPSEDGPNHLAVAHVLASYGDPGSPFPQYLSTQTGFRPSTALYEVLLLAGRLVSLQTAEKCLVSLALILLPVSVLLFALRNVPRRTVSVLLTMPFLLGWAFAMGFLSFQLGMALGVITLAFGWEPRLPDERRVDIGWQHGLASVAYFLCVWFHPVVALITGLVFLLLEWRTVLRVSQWPRMLVVVGPAAAFLVGSYFMAQASSQPSVESLETYFSDPVSVVGSAFEYNIAYSPFELVPRIAALALILPFAYRTIRANPPLRASAEAAIGRVVLTLLVLYCVLPGTLVGWAYCSARFLLYGALLLPLAAELPERIGRRVLILAPALTSVVLAIQWPFIHRDSRKMQDVLEVAVSLPRGARFIPVEFNSTVLGPQTTGDSWAELVVEHDAVASQLFAAGRRKMGGEHFRTLGFRPGVLDADVGTLPWSGFEMWSDVWRTCADPRSPLRWFVHVDGSCNEALSARKQELEQVIDRYDYVLMLGEPALAQELMASHLRLVSHVGSAWMYAIVHPSSGIAR